MATLTTNTSEKRSFLAAFGAAIMTWFERYAEAQSRRARIVALEAKTDEELAAMGLRRDRIVHHVFRDLYYV
ncbi:hypothetical protein SAMN05216196_101526 [Lutimaribacter pacificus]|uniref:DUF1127 domain-containing protein n=1 Tax=Lutimaribacter pacificus TaxID=391948 RepID=A0A1H0BCT4_9RHOB|nr:hypothetical protein [Lutimaribacter pacificus]SDN43425.1 hypothetical protein SAMN05216196_101526 [Lutimaribacter pacificus]SHJ57638.1 hypothetical protein SAMN05444142_101691 [Lutimaribacter pacificus]